MFVPFLFTRLCRLPPCSEQRGEDRVAVLFEARRSIATAHRPPRPDRGRAPPSSHHEAAPPRIYSLCAPPPLPPLYPSTRMCRCGSAPSKPLSCRRYRPPRAGAAVRPLRAAPPRPLPFSTSRRRHRSASSASPRRRHCLPPRAGVAAHPLPPQLPPMRRRGTGFMRERETGVNG